MPKHPQLTTIKAKIKDIKSKLNIAMGTLPEVSTGPSESFGEEFRNRGYKVFKGPDDGYAPKPEVSTKERPKQTTNPNVMDYGANNPRKAKELVEYLRGEVYGNKDELKTKLIKWVDNNKNVIPTEEFKKEVWKEFEKQTKPPWKKPVGVLVTSFPDADKDGDINPYIKSILGNLDEAYKNTVLLLEHSKKEGLEDHIRFSKKVEEFIIDTEIYIKDNLAFLTKGPRRKSSLDTYRQYKEMDKLREKISAYSDLCFRIYVDGDSMRKNIIRFAKQASKLTDAIGGTELGGYFEKSEKLDIINNLASGNFNFPRLNEQSKIQNVYMAALGMLFSAVQSHYV